MFYEKLWNWIWRMIGFQSFQNRSSNLFEDNFEIIDLDAIPANKRTLIENVGSVTLYSNTAIITKKKISYFEVVFSKKKQYAFIVYHSTSKDVTEKYYKSLSILLNNLENSISPTKTIAFENLTSIMECYQCEPDWTSTHIAAQIGSEIHFKESARIAKKEIDSQSGSDKSTPLHLAIKRHALPIVRAILDLNPNMDLTDAKNYSVLHYAALSSYEVFCVILKQPKMFDRILWKNHQGSTALHLACFGKKYNIVFEFLKFGLTVQMLVLPPPKPDDSHLNRKKKRHDPSLDQIVNFNEQDFCDIDCKDMELAGCPLHWVVHRRLLEKLLKYKFDLNIPNMIGDTPLNVMAKRKRLRCAITLMCAGANVNSKNKFGNTPLHHAIHVEDIIMVQTLIVFEADINAVNKMGSSVRHLASKDSAFSKIILFLLSSLGASRCPQKTKDCNPGCSFDGTFEGKCPALLSESNENQGNLFRNMANASFFEQELAKNPKEELESGKKGINMLTLDGGGIRGLIVTQILLELQKYLDRHVADYFEWISGTSTGSFITTFLALRKPIPEIRNVYFTVKDKVFVGDRPYDAEPLENILKEMVGPNLKMEDLKTIYKKHIIIPSVLYDRFPMKLHLFRSYESHHDLLDQPDHDPGFTPQPSKEQLVWKACRASGAAPTYFKAFGPFIDGGVMANNPTLDAMTEFQFYNSALSRVGRSKECAKLKFILSLGTGRHKIEQSKAVDISAFSVSLMDLNNQIRYVYQMANLLLSEICMTDNHIVNRAEAFCSSSNVIYFRINPIFNKLIELDEVLDFKIINLLWETKRFMYQKRKEVAGIAEYLKKFTQFSENSEVDLTAKSSMDFTSSSSSLSKSQNINPATNISKETFKSFTNTKSTKIILGEQFKECSIPESPKKLGDSPRIQ